MNASRTPLVTIIIPVYNTRDYLPNCLDSVLTQTYRELEIILIDDGSTDGSGDLCDDYAGKDERIRVTHQDNQGAVRARKAGIAATSGQYLCFVDSDDTVEENYIADLVKRTSDDVDLVTAGAFKEVDGNWIPRQDAFREGLYRSGKEMEYLLKNLMKYQLDTGRDGILPYMYAKLYRTDKAREAVRETAENLVYTDDSDFVFHYILKCRSVYVTHDKNYRYRERKNSLCLGENRFILRDLNTLYLSLYPQFSEHHLHVDLIRQLQAFIRARVNYALEKMGDFVDARDTSRIPEGLFDRSDLPAVSVIVPVYNMAPYLPECLDSLMDQSMSDLEIICVDDGSTDGSGLILDEYARRDDRIRVIHKKNSGYGHSMNIGLDAARGEYIGILESDDFAAQDMFYKLYHAAKNNDADVVKGNFAEVRETGRTETRFGNWAVYGKVFPAKEFPELLYDRMSIWSALYRREFLNQNGIRFHETPGASFQDTSFFFMVWLHSERMLLIPEITVNYRMTNGNSSINSPSKTFCICNEFNHIEKHLDKIEASAEIRQIEQIMKYMKYEWNFRRLGEQYQYAFLLEMAAQFREADEKGLLKRNLWPTWLWDDMERMLSDTDGWFLSRARQVIPDQVAVGEREYLRLCRKGVRDALKEGDYFFYGAGRIAERMLERFRDAGIKDPQGIIVTNKAEEATFHSLPVFGIDEMELSDDRVVMVAVGKRLLPEVYGELLKRGHRNVIVPDSLFWRIWDAGC